MQKNTAETTDVECVSQNLSQIPVQMGNSYFLDFQHSFIGEKGASEQEWEPTVWPGLKHRCDVVTSPVLLMETASLSVT